MALTLLLFLLQQSNPVILEAEPPKAPDPRHVVARGFQDAHVARLFSFKEIETLRFEPGRRTFGFNEITDRALEEIAKLTGLHSLDLRQSPNLTAEGLAHLKALRSLRVLDLGECQVTDAGVAALGDLSELTSLDVSGQDAQITDAGAASVSRLKKLRTLRIGASDGKPAAITDRGLDALAWLADLRTLDLTGCGNITDAGLKHLSNLSHLSSLSLFNCARVTDAGLQHLSSLKELSTLYLVGARISDAGLAHLAKMPLRTLHLDGGITDKGLAHLEKLAGLRDLRLSHCDQLTDAGLERLAKLPHLEDLNLSGPSKITEEGIRRLKTARPGLSIEPLWRP